MAWQPMVFAIVSLAMFSCDPASGVNSPNRATEHLSATASTPTANQIEKVEIFSENAREVGLVFDHYSAGSTRYYFPEIMGSGIALLDFDNDGDLDVFVSQGANLGTGFSVDELRTPRQFDQSDRLFENRLIPDEQLLFVDVTKEAGIETTGYSMGVSTGDIDGDGWVDVYVSRFGKNSMLRNLGGGRFEEVIDESGANDDRWNSSASFFDYDADGDLDLFVTAYVAFNLRYDKTCVSPGGIADYCSPKAYRPLMDRLFQNDGSGVFTDVTQSSGINTGVGSGLGVVFDDFNGDNHLDLYVANDGNENFLWINQGNGSFVQDGVMSGSAYNQDGKVEASMGVVAGDFDNDGDSDLFMTHLKQESNTLYINNGQGIFLDATTRTQLKRPSLPLTGFGTVWFDYDNDGWLDLYIANGGVTTGNDDVDRTDAAYQQVDQLYQNIAGQQFQDRTNHSGSVMQALTIGRGVAMGDIDNDGDLDLVTNDNNGPLRLLLNQLDSKHNWLRVKLHSPGKNPRAIGARVAVITSDGQVWRRMRTDGSYQSASEAVVHFGLGQNVTVKSVVVEWPSGSTERWADVNTNQTITLHLDQGQALE